MEDKKLGIILLALSLIFLFFIMYFNSNLSIKSDEMNCTTSQECAEINSSLSITHAGFGFFGFMLALGFYILFFNKTERKILERLEQNKNEEIREKQFDWIYKALDNYEKKVLKAVKDQEGITQSTLKLRTDMSKAKLSYVLQELEKRNLIKRTKKGKTLQVFLKV